MIDATGIWRHAGLFGDDGAPARLALAEGWTLGEGDTPLQPWPELASELGLDALLLKREDLNPGHSHKDRGLLYQVAAHRAAGPVRGFVLSSSGNAAVSAAAACARSGDRLVAFVAPDTAASKYGKLLRSGAHVVVSDKPINYARSAGRLFGLTDLRGSRDPLAPVGYRSLAGELAEEGDLDHVLTFNSSGTSAMGLLDGFAAAGRDIAVWSAQAGVCIGLARELDPSLEDEPDNPAGRLGIRNPPDAPEIVERLVASGGGALAVTRGDVLAMAERMEARDLRTSAEGAAALAAVARLARDGRIGGTVAVVITGHAEQWDRYGTDDRDQETDAGDPVHVDSYLALREALVGLGLEPA